MIAITVDNLRKNYGSTEILQGVNLTIEEGEFFALMGPNGSGKTTLTSIIASTTLSTSGTVNIHGYNISDKPEKVKALIGYVPQENFSSPRLTGRENLLYFAQLAGLNRYMSKKWADELLEKMGLSKDANKKVSHYSGGMRKRLEVATALMPDVKVIILDEPTTGFDPAVRKEFMGLLLDINHEGTTIFLVTHIGEDAEVAKTVAFMNNGQILVKGNPEELKKKFTEFNVITIITSVISKRVYEILQQSNTNGKLIQTNEGYKIYCERPDEIIPLISKNLAGIGCKATSIELSPPSLEDIFFSLLHEI